jgi:hypothetical protein
MGVCNFEETSGKHYNNDSRIYYEDDYIVCILMICGLFNSQRTGLYSTLTICQSGRRLNSIINVTYIINSSFSFCRLFYEATSSYTIQRQMTG